MPSESMLYPLLAQVALTLLLSVIMGVSRMAAIYRGRVPLGSLRSRATAQWPARVAPIGDHYQNLFELPVLFYALVAVVLVLDAASAVDVWLAWGFVAARLVHMLIHVTYNNVVHRFTAFLVGWALIGVLWGRLALRILGA